MQPLKLVNWLLKPKDWYYVDNFYHKIPHDKVGEIYQKSDILIKTLKVILSYTSDNFQNPLDCPKIRLDQ